MQATPRSAILVIDEHKVLLIERTQTGKPVYYVLPGGGIDVGESPEQAAVREMKEELGVDIEVMDKQIGDTQNDRKTWVVSASLHAGNVPKWIESHKQTHNNHYAVTWVPPGDLASLNIFPCGVVAIIQDVIDKQKKISDQ